MIRTVPTGDLGLDLLLGGGWQLVRRLPDRESATVLVRGGAGAGKTLLGIHVALELAKALGGDVVVGCVEILPTEYVAQLQSARSDIDRGRVVVLPGEGTPSQSPGIFCGLLTELGATQPDLVAALEGLLRDVAAAGGRPAVVVVDSLSEGYGLGISVPRTSADAVMKFAAQGGIGLVLCEEALDERPSPWVFAADTVLELGVESRERGRWIEVRKHRFGASVTGRHELALVSGARPSAFPEPHAWTAPHRGRVLQARGWRYLASRGMPALTWGGALNPDDPLEAIQGAVVLVSAPEVGLARTLAFGLTPLQATAGGDLVLELDPLLLDSEAGGDANASIDYVPVVQGPARTLRHLVERFAVQFGEGPRIRRVVVGNLGLLLVAPGAAAWLEVLRIFCALTIESGWDCPLVAWAGLSAGDEFSPARSHLTALADVRVEAGTKGNVTFAIISERWRRSTQLVTWPQDASSQPLPAAVAHMDKLPRPHDRRGFGGT